ncbi:MAG: AAA family ATPase [Alphaproteobacteria bacterium]|nr:AAA family ATPase [Alphaproteobacteria bacterium]
MYEQIYLWLSTQFVDNEMFIGVITASSIGTALYLARALPETLWGMALRYGSVSLEVDNTDPGFDWIKNWLARHPYVRRSRKLRLSGRQYRIDADQSGESEAWDLVPGEGRHVFLHKGRPVMLNYWIDEENSKGRFLRQHFHLRTVGRSQEFLRALVTEAAILCTEEVCVQVHNWRDGYWELSCRKRPRPMDSVILPCEQAARLIADADWFFKAGDWYAERGIPYRRGFLFSGPPGTGKSSVVLALASHLGKPVYALNLASVSQDSVLMEAFAQVPQDAILLVEDIDAIRIAKKRTGKDAKKEGAQGLGMATLSGLLNAIDGVAAPEGRLLVMTSNHPEHLDPALIRPGRIDLHEWFDLMGMDEIRRMYLRFHPGREADAVHFARSIGRPISPAELQCKLLAGDPSGPREVGGVLDTNAVEVAMTPAAAE